MRDIDSFGHVSVTLTEQIVQHATLFFMSLFRSIFSDGSVDLLHIIGLITHLNGSVASEIVEQNQ